MDQDGAASLMGVSRQTYGRILAEARAIVAHALVTGNVLRVEGGNYQLRGGRGRRMRRHGGRGLPDAVLPKGGEIMPKGDGKGPDGQGPAGRGRGGCGMGAGRGRRRGAGPFPGGGASARSMSRDEELAMLKAEAEQLNLSLDAIRKRMAALETSDE